MKSLLFLLILISSFVFASEAEIVISGKRAILNKVKDPDSVIFKDVFHNYTQEIGVVACGRFNAKNSFGAYTGYTRFISSGKTTFIEGQNNTNPPFPKLWRMACM